MMPTVSRRMSPLIPDRAEKGYMGKNMTIILLSGKMMAKVPTMVRTAPEAPSEGIATPVATEIRHMLQ